MNLRGRDIPMYLGIALTNIALIILSISNIKLDLVVLIGFNLGICVGVGITMVESYRMITKTTKLINKYVCRINGIASKIELDESKDHAKYIYIRQIVEGIRDLGFCNEKDLTLYIAKGYNESNCYLDYYMVFFCNEDSDMQYPIIYDNSPMNKFQKSFKKYHIINYLDPIIGNGVRRSIYSAPKITLCSAFESEIGIDID